MSVEAASFPVRVIERRSGWAPVDVRELWEYRDLLAFLIWRDVKVRYKQTVLGAAWAILQPLATMAVFTVLFGRWANMPSDGMPYPVFAFAALTAWTFFSNAVSSAANSLVGSTHLVSKVYFPRVLIVLSTVGTGLVDLAVSLLVMLGLLVYYGIGLSWSLAALPLLTLVIISVAVGIGSALAALCAVYRDVRYVVPFLLQIWMFASPVIYPLTLVPDSRRWIFFLNPMAGAIDGFRSALLGLPFRWAPIAWSVVVAILVVWSGLTYFRRVERRVADLI